MSDLLGMGSLDIEERDDQLFDILEGEGMSTVWENAVEEGELGRSIFDIATIKDGVLLKAAHHARSL